MGLDEGVASFGACCCCLCFVSAFIGWLVPKNMSFIPGGKVDIKKTWKMQS